MALGEFELIRRFFAHPPRNAGDVALGIGDDCALLRPPVGELLAVTADTLVEGIHFAANVDPATLGHKSLAVNLSDLAAMGATPRWVTLALTLPAPDAAWLEHFAAGFFGLAREFGVELVGGDTTRGPLSITVQALGSVPAATALRRSGASPGDRIYVSGHLGSAGLGLKQRRGDIDFVAPGALEALDRPQPRIALGLALRGLASACIDISDGLAADLGHILEASRAGARIELERLPVSAEVRRHLDATQDWSLPLSAGDDYELCFTLPREQTTALEQRLQQIGTTVTPIGWIEAEPGLRITRGGRLMPFTASGYQHFTAT